jgi:phosphate acyltransferase
VLGNVVIKFFEGLSTYIFDLFRAEFEGSLRGRLAYLLLRPGIGRIRTVFDWERVGGSPLLGVKGNVIITHGRAKRRMIGFGVGVAATMARTRVPELIAEAFRPSAGKAAGDAPGDAGPATSEAGNAARDESAAPGRAPLETAS